MMSGSDPKERLKNIPGVIGMILRGELSKKCDLCGELKASSWTPLQVNDPLFMAEVQEVYRRLGKPNFVPNQENKIPYNGHCSECALKYNQELAKVIQKR